ncbi:hypothetical protein HPB48_001908 [Haemaphysalis longicornis]|uniref:Uncharacterized protein n=1 Tax=Haemaphysalis longicornis TaxID=44386 RepID=A0A9J6G524_HAELO|nr:hypothetical protein HPB48_001908 [Haemaphysalis longicornis]
MRPQGGLDLSKVNAALLSDAIFMQAHLTNDPEDQIRINIRSNFIVASTPFEYHAQQYLQLASLQWHSPTDPLQNRIPPPSTTTFGAIFQIPPEDPERFIMNTLTHHNPTITVLNARRMKGTGFVQVLFLGPHLPFWVRHRAVTLLCYPYNPNTEVCMACWSAGHREDTCPNPSARPHCAICGVTDPAPNHPCRPTCIVGGEGHRTGESGCPKRFQPRRPPQKTLTTITTTPPQTGPGHPPTSQTTNRRTYSKIIQCQEMQQLHQTVNIRRAENEPLNIDCSNNDSITPCPRPRHFPQTPRPPFRPLQRNEHSLRIPTRPHAHPHPLPLPSPPFARK